MKYNVKDFTLDEKLKLLSGKDKWRLEDLNGKLPSIFLSDGPHGLRKIDENKQTIPATVTPSLVNIANTWNRELSYLDGQVIADDCIEYGADVLLAPGINMKRSPLCGRNFEYFSEDPFLAGELAKHYIEGVQSKGIGTSLKHFYANNSEFDRLGQSIELDERTAREIYLSAFEKALEAKPWTVMCSYNPINGIWASENKHALKDILRDEFGFDGVIVSDWEAVHNGWRSVKATLDIRMPYSPYNYDELKYGLEKGYITEDEVDERVEKILELIEKTTNNNKKITTTKEERHTKAVEIARDSIVLLKNEENVLPLRNEKVCVFGPFAQTPCFGGDGSARSISAYTTKHLAEEIEIASNGNVEAISRYGWFGITPLAITYAADAFECASTCDKVILCMGTGKEVEREGYNRDNISLNKMQENFILEMAKYNKNIIVVLNSGSSIDMSEWIDHVKGVVWIGFGGEGIQQATAEILTGKICPSGKISESFPLDLDDTVSYDYQGNFVVNKYNEGVLVGYRYYDKFDIDVLFPFGYGLSYAEFDYSNLSIEKESEVDYNVTFTVTNKSNIQAKEIVQLYVKDVLSRVVRPEKELKGFDKINLKPGESKKVTIKLNSRSFAYYNTELKNWHVENGEFIIMIGSSSRDIRLKQSILIKLPEEQQYSIRSDGKQ